MFKMLRKYNKVILVIGGSLLMVAFLLPQALQQIGQDPASRVVMRVGGQEITGKEANLAGREYEALRQLGIRLDLEGGPGHWLLLTHDARRRGFVGGPADGQSLVPELIDNEIQLQMRMQPAPLDPASPEWAAQMDGARAAVEARLDDVARQVGFTADQMDHALSQFRGVSRMINEYGQIAGVSQARSVVEAKRRLDSANIDYVFIPADRAMTGIEEPADGALLAHFERYKDTPPGDAESEYGIGYRLPQRVKLEWIALDRAAVMGIVRGQLDAFHARRQQRRETAAETPAQAMLGQRIRAGWTLPEVEASKPLPEGWAQTPPTPEQVIEEHAERMTDAVMREAEQTVREAIATAVWNLPEDEDYRVLPEDWSERRPDFERIRDSIAQRVKDATGVAIPAPAVTIKNAEWLTAQEVQALPGIGRSFQTRGSRMRAQFPQVVMRVRELGDPQNFGLQAGVPGDPTEDFQRNRYYFTVLDARKESAPDSLDEVREKVVRDVKRIAAFDRLRADAETYRMMAATEGLAAVAAAFPPPPPAEGEAPGATLPVKAGVRVTRLGMMPNDPNVNAELFREAVLSAAAKLDPTVPAEEIDAAERTFAAPLPAKLGLAVARINASMPATQEDYRAQERSVVSGLQREEMARAEANPFFSMEQLRKRLDVEGADGEPEEDAEPAEQAGS